jgi:hypothetical protein
MNTDTPRTVKLTHAMNRLTKSPIRAVWRFVQRLVRAWPLMRYGAGQHDLICNATGTGKDYLDDGCTAYESVCVLMLKLDAAREYLEQQEGEDAAELLKFLNAHQDSEEFCMMPLYVTGDSSSNTKDHQREASGESDCS